MSDSIITKKAIAEGLKHLTQTKSFDKISISDITTSCGLNRQTFYYHFQDKYELLNWIYYNEGFVHVIEGITFENWEKKLLFLLELMKKEHVFYHNTIQCEQDYFKDYLFDITSTLFSEAIEKLDIKNKLSKEDKLFISEFYSYGICGVIISWVKNNMKEPAALLAENLNKLAIECKQLAYQRYCEER